MNSLTSGNAAVDQVGRMSIVGNVVPASWFKTILSDSGKPHYLAIMILADIVYWYRPTEIRDERTGQLLGWKKKFRHDMLQRTYEDYATLMGESERTIIRAIAHLENLGVVFRHRRDLVFKGGMTVRNILFLELIPGRLYELTFGEYAGNRNCQDSLTDLVSVPDRFVRDGGQNCQGWLTELSGVEDRSVWVDGQNCQEAQTELSGIMDRSVSCSGPSCQDSLTDLVSVPDRFVRDGGQICQGDLTDLSDTVDRSVRTDTNITTENSTERIISINPSNTSGIQGKIDADQKDEMDETNAYIEIIKENVNYDFHQEHDSRNDWELFEELFEIVCDIVCISRRTIRINEEEYPYELVKSRYLKLNEEHLAYVIDCMRKSNTQVRNMRSYMMTALYNAPNTISSYYGRKAQHDLYG